MPTSICLSYKHIVFSLDGGTRCLRSVLCDPQLGRRRQNLCVRATTEDDGHQSVERYGLLNCKTQKPQNKKTRFLPGHPRSGSPKRSVFSVSMAVMPSDRTDSPSMKWRERRRPSNRESGTPASYSHFQNASWEIHQRFGAKSVTAYCRFTFPRVSVREMVPSDWT